MRNTELNIELQLGDMVTPETYDCGISAILCNTP